MKKFNFNFKFLDRFKKSKPTSEEISPESINETQAESSQEYQEQEENSFAETLDEPSSLDEHLDSPAHVSEDSEEATLVYKENSLNQTEENENDYKDDNPEDFAEKTLGDFNIQQFREKNAQLINDNIGEDKTDANMSFKELEPPVKPKESFRFKFPSFKNAFSKENIKENFKKNINKKKALEKLDKLSWDDFILRFFSPYSRGKIHGVFIIALVVISTYLIGKNIALFISKSAPIVSSVRSNISNPIEKADTTLQDLNRISSTNLFNAKETDKVENVKVVKDISNIICDDAERPTSEPLKLLDTIVLQDSVKSVASVQVRGGSELVNVREGEQLNETVEVSRINRMKVILKNLSTGECEYIASEEEDVPLMTNMKILSPKAGSKLFKSNNPNIKNVGNNFKIKRQFRDSMINNMSEVLTQAKAIQINNPDGSLAFKMTEVVPGSIYSQLNIQNDDIITSINGKKIENLNELMTLLGRIKEIDQFQIGRKRNGMDENLEFGFE